MYRFLIFRKATDFWCVNFESCYFTKCVHQLREDSGRIFVAFYISSAKKDILTSSFSVPIILSQSTYFIGLSKMPSMIFDTDGRREKLCLFPYFNENESSISCNRILTVGFLYIAFIKLNYVFYIPRFFRHFMKMWCLIFVLCLFFI